jgi:hypothetical protein
MAPPISLTRNAPPPSIARDPSSATSGAGYRDVSTRFAFDGKNIQNLGDKLTGLQNDLFNSGYYQGSSYGTEVDGKLGPKTNNAIKSLQNDLVAAGFLPQGSANGTFDPAQMGQAISKLMQQGVPDVVSPDIMQRLSRFVQSAGQAPAQMPASTAQSSFTQGAGSNPVALNSPAATPAATPGADQGDQRIQNTLTVLDNIVRQQGIATPNGQPPTQADYQHAIAQVARGLAGETNTPDLLAAAAKKAGVDLGFNPAHNSDSEIDGFLKMIADQIDVPQNGVATGAQTPAAATGTPAASGQPAQLSQAGQALSAALSSNIDLMPAVMAGKNPSVVMAGVIAQRAQSLGTGQTLRNNLAKLGLDVGNATDAQLNGMVAEVVNSSKAQSTLQFGASAPVAAPTASTQSTGATTATTPSGSAGPMNSGASAIYQLLGQNIDLMSSSNPTMTMNKTILARAQSLGTGQTLRNNLSRMGLDVSQASDADLNNAMAQVMGQAQSQSSLQFGGTPAAAPVASTQATSGATSSTGGVTQSAGMTSGASAIYQLLGQNIDLMSASNPTIAMNKEIARRAQTLGTGQALRNNLSRMGLDVSQATDAQLNDAMNQVMKQAQSQSTLQFGS